MARRDPSAAAPATAPMVVNSMRRERGSSAIAEPPLENDRGNRVASARGGHGSRGSWKPSMRGCETFLTTGRPGPRIRPGCALSNAGGHMTRRVLTGVVLLAFLLLASLPAQPQSPSGMKLYVFTSGSLGGFPKAALQIGGQGNIDWAPVSFYVIQHPKGNVMFDTGNNDKTITDPDGWWGPLAKGFGLKMTQND